MEKTEDNQVGIKQSSQWFEYIALKSVELTNDFYFWLLLVLFTLTEPILCSRDPHGGVYVAQIVVMILSSIQFVIQVISLLVIYWNFHLDKDIMDKQPWKGSWLLFTHFLTRGEYVLEFICLLNAWVFIWYRPGVAALRCFRVFRLLWLADVAIFRDVMITKLDPIIGGVYVVRVFRVFRFATKSMSALGNEMFRLTNRTRGGLLLMMVLFYSAFVFGMALWIETGSENALCGTVNSCTFTLLRLTFFDGNGFDYAFFLTNNHKYLFVLVMAYLCLTSFGILNGLVGIFGTTFASASEEAFGRPEVRPPKPPSRRLDLQTNLDQNNAIDYSNPSVPYGYSQDELDELDPDDEIDPEALVHDSPRPAMLAVSGRNYSLGSNISVTRKSEGSHKLQGLREFKDLRQESPNTQIEHKDSGYGIFFKKNNTTKTRQSNQSVLSKYRMNVNEDTAIENLENQVQTLKTGMELLLLNQHKLQLTLDKLLEKNNSNDGNNKLDGTPTPSRPIKDPKLHLNEVAPKKDSTPQEKAIESLTQQSPQSSQSPMSPEYHSIHHCPSSSFGLSADDMRLQLDLEGFKSHSDDEPDV